MSRECEALQAGMKTAEERALRNDGERINRRRGAIRLMRPIVLSPDDLIHHVVLSHVLGHFQSKVLTGIRSLHLDMFNFH